MSKEYLLLSAEEFAQLEDYELRYALQQTTGYMAVAAAKKRASSDGYHAYLAAKEELADLKMIASTIQTHLRTNV